MTNILQLTSSAKQWFQSKKFLALLFTITSLQPAVFILPESNTKTILVACVSLAGIAYIIVQGQLDGNLDKTKIEFAIKSTNDIVTDPKLQQAITDIIDTTK